MLIGSLYKAVDCLKKKTDLSLRRLLEHQQLYVRFESMYVSGLPVVTVCRRGSNCDLLQTGSQADSAQDVAGKRPQASLPGRGLACTSPSPLSLKLRPNLTQTLPSRQT